MKLGTYLKFNAEVNLTLIENKSLFGLARNWDESGILVWAEALYYVPWTSVIMLTKMDDDDSETASAS